MSHVGGNPVVMLDPGYWQSAFAGNPAAGMNALQMLNQVNLLDQMQGRSGGQPPFFPGMLAHFGTLRERTRPTLRKFVW